MTLARWYHCSGCGPSLRCDVCGETECSQGMTSETCPGCAKAKQMRKGSVPWNMRVPPTWVKEVQHPEGYISREAKYPRPVRHIRRRETRLEIFRAKSAVWRSRRAPERLYGRKDRRPRREQYNESLYRGMVTE